MVQEEFSWILYMNGWSVPSDCPIFDGISLLSCASNVTAPITLVGSHNVCIGNDEEKLSILVHAREGTFLASSGT